MTSGGAGGPCEDGRVTPIDAAAHEDELVRRARAGDSDAFAAIAERFRGELQLHCYRIVGSVQDAEDLVQETVLAAWRGLERVRGPDVCALVAVPDRDQPVSERCARSRPTTARGSAAA